MLKKAVFTISIDVEMAWGSFDLNGHIKYKDAFKKSRSTIDAILELFKRYDITATWAMVGHLFLDKCSMEKGILHPDIVRPKHRWFRKDWFAFDPGSDLSNDEIWYGRDIVDKIISFVPRQEIGSHSFCHPIFSDKGCSKETAKSDIAKCVSLAKERNIELRSFVFPRNCPGHLDVLSEYGFKIFRGKEESFLSVRPNMLRKALILLSDMIPTAAALTEASVAAEKGIASIGGSMQFRFAYGASRFIAPNVRFIKSKKAIDIAIEKNKIFSLWFHPISFAWKTKEMLKEFERILNYAVIKRKNGSLDILNMSQIMEGLDESKK